MEIESDLFICNYLIEMVILSDGRVTTCCLDALGANAYASIYSDSFSEVIDKYLAVRKKVAHDYGSLPKCAECHRIFEKTGNLNMIYHATDEQVAGFIQQGRDFTKYRFVIEPTSQCNLKCKGCIQSSLNLSTYREKPFIDFDHLERWLLPNITKVREIRFYNYGETFLHPKAIDFLVSLKGGSAEVNIEIATNGLMLDAPEKQERLIKAAPDSIVFSIHGSNQKNIEKYMTERMQFDKLMKILRQLVRLRNEAASDTPLLVWKYLLFEWNDSDDNIIEAKQRAKEIGVDRVLFEIASHPAPSKRFTPDSESWKELTADMTMTNSIVAVWDTKKQINVPTASSFRKFINTVFRSGNG